MRIDSRLSSKDFSIPPFSFVHGSVRLDHELTEWNSTLRIEPRHSNAQGQWIARFRCTRLFEILLQTTENDFLRLIGRLRCEHDKLVAAHARKNVGITERSLEGISGTNDGEIPFLVTVGVIYLFQIVDIAKQQKKTLLIAPGQFELLRSSGKKATPVEEASQVIREGEIAEFSVQKSLLDSAPDRGMSSDSHGLSVGMVGLQKLGNLVHFLQYLAELGIGSLQSRRKILCESIFCGAVPAT